MTKRAKARRMFVVLRDGHPVYAESTRDDAEYWSLPNQTIIEVAPVPRVSARDGAVSVNGTVVCFGLEDAPGFARDLRRALKEVESW